MTQETGGLSRRSIIRGAAWSVPVVAVAVATPLAAASGGVPNADANYHWEGAAAADWSTLTKSGWSVQIIPTAPVAGGVISVTVVLSAAVTLTSVPGGWTGPAVGTTSDTFVFSQPTGAAIWGHNLDFLFSFDDALLGTTLTSAATMTISPAVATFTGDVATSQILLDSH